MTGLWAPWYENVTERQPYKIDDDDLTYRLGAEYLQGLHVEDWGCGLGWMRQYVPEHLYTGIDGTRTPFSDVVTELTTYQSHTEAIFMRHVLEHNLEWELVLENALRSFIKRMFLVLYTPPVAQTHIHLVEPELGVPELRFLLNDITDRILLHANYDASYVGTETVIKIER